MISDQNEISPQVTNPADISFFKVKLKHSTVRTRIGQPSVCLPGRGRCGGCHPRPPTPSPLASGQGKWHSQDPLPGLFEYRQYYPAPFTPGKTHQNASGPLSGCLDFQLPHRQITICQAEGHHVWHCHQQHRSSAGDCAVPPPLHSVHSGLLLQLWYVSHPEVRRWHGHRGVYQRQWRGGIQEPGEELCCLVPHKQPAAQHLKDWRTGHWLREGQTQRRWRLWRLWRPTCILGTVAQWLALLPHS